MTSAQPFALVLAIWGTKYGAAHVNQLVESAFDQSPGLAEVILLTDRRRKGIDHRVRQEAFPPPFDGAEFFGWGYRAKLAVFSPAVLPRGMACVFLDLDSVVVGDLGRIATLVRRPDDLFMLPPAGIGFGKLRRWLDRLRGGRSFPVGNSSILAYHADASPNLAETYVRVHKSGGLAAERRMQIDDVVISWFGRGRIRGVPTSAGVMFRREYLSKVPFWAVLKARLPWVRRRREQIAAVTLNGVAVKPEMLAALPEGATVTDGRGRRGPWTDAALGPVRARLVKAGQRIAAEGEATENDDIRRD